jgi:hypothetical protein
MTKKIKQRIRYVKKDTKLVTKNELISKTGARYHVFIDLETKTYLIRNMVSQRKYEGGENINNMNVLKRTVRKHLSHLGIELETESRNRSFGLCNKGFSESENRRLKKEQQKENENIND